MLFEIQKVTDIRARDQMRSFVSQGRHRATYVHLRYASYLGLGSRLIVLALLLGAREVSFVGFDGMSSDGPRHAFEHGKELSREYHPREE